MQSVFIASPGVLQAKRNGDHSEYFCSADCHSFF